MRAANVRTGLTPAHRASSRACLFPHLRTHSRTKIARASSPFIVEFTGTLFLTLVVAMTGGDPTAPISVGFILTAMIFMGGHISGGHYNPAVSLAVYLRGKVCVCVRRRHDDDNMLL